MILDDKTVYNFYCIKRYPSNSILTCKTSTIPKIDSDKRMRKPIEFRKVKTCRVSARRSKIVIDDIIQCNTFDYFVTLTLGTQERLNDTASKKLWNSWRHEFKRNYPSAYYLAVPEYHKKGGLHIHLCIGGITAEQLQLQVSDYVCCSWAVKKYLKLSTFNKQKSKHVCKACDGIPIYNVGAWKFGFSTATKIQSQVAVQSYITKYITKGGVDPRFCDSRRYWVSKNIKRPIMEKSRQVETFDTSLAKHFENKPLLFADLTNAYYVFDNDNKENV